MAARLSLSSIRRILLLYTLFLGAELVSCTPAPKSPLPLFSTDPSQNLKVKNELKYLEFKDRLTREDRLKIEQDLTHASEAFNLPKALLWCLLFQESRFDSFKNATNQLTAKGMGQFTQSALDEINIDTDEYDLRTSAALDSQITPKTLPLSFAFKAKPLVKKPGTKKKYFPEQALTSYFRTATAIFASAAYLNNRFQQLKSALDHQGIQYDSQVLWLYAAAAYNKGSRTVFLLLTNEYMTSGERALTELLKDPKSTYALLTHPKRLEYALKEIWTQKTRSRYMIELLRNMEAISSCALTGTHL